MRRPHIHVHLTHKQRVGIVCVAATACGYCFLVLHIEPAYKGFEILVAPVIERVLFGGTD